MGEMEMTTVTLNSPHILKDDDVQDFYESVFIKCDTNKDGVISISELKNFIETQENCDLPDGVIEMVYKKYDKNMDTHLDFEEFVEMIESPTFVTTFQKLSNRILKFIVLPSRNRRTIKICRTITLTGVYNEERQFRKTAVGMIALSIFQIMIYYINQSTSTDDTPSNGHIYQALHFDQNRKYQIYRYFTYSILHSSAPHLFGNIIFQLIVGIPLELVHLWRVPLLYFVGTVGGSLFHGIMESTGLVGASAGAYSVLTAHVAAVIMNWREMSHPAVVLIVTSIVVLIDWFCQAMLIQKQISYWSHFGGGVVGLLLGVNLLRNLRVTKLEIYIRYISLVALGTFFLTCIILNATK